MGSKDAAEGLDNAEVAVTLAGGAFDMYLASLDTGTSVYRFHLEGSVKLRAKYFRDNQCSINISMSQPRKGDYPLPKLGDVAAV